MTKTVLFILDKIQGIFKWLDIDYSSLRAIVEVKMMIENRRAHGNQNKQKKNNEDNNTFVKSLGFQALFSFLFGIMILSINETVYNIYLWNFAFIMFMIAFNIISDFIDVLFDTSDNIILIPRPIDSKVIWMARLIHISVFILTLTLANSLGSIVFTIVKLGFLAGLIYFLSVVLLCIITVLLTAILYLLLTKIVNGERLKDIIGYAQIFFSVFLMIGYQFGSKLISTLFLDQTINIKWWHYITPPAWFAGAMELMVNHKFETPFLLFVLLIMTIPFLSLFIMNRYLAPLFSKSLSEYGTPENVEKQASINHNTGFSFFLSKILTKNSLERAAFTFVWKITNRDRKFKIRAYPIFGLQIYFMIKIFTDAKEQGFTRWMVLYYTTFCVYGVIQQIYFSDNWKAAWIFKNSPIQFPGNIILGGMKAIIIKVAVPIFTVVGAIMVYKFGLEVIDDIIFAFVNTLLFISAGITIGQFSMPFSKDISEQNKAGKSWSRIIVLLIVVPIIGGIHYFVSKTTYGVIILTPIFLTVSLLIFSEYRKITWEKIKE